MQQENELVCPSQTSLIEKQALSEGGYSDHAKNTTNLQKAV